MALGLRSGIARSIVPQEITRILGNGLERAMQARLEIARVLARHGYTAAVPMPDISTKEKAQRYIGLDPQKLNDKKQKFLKTVVPKWLEEAKAKGKLVAMK